MTHILINGMALLMSLLFPQNVLRIQSHSGCNPSLAFIQGENNFAGSTNIVSQAFDSDNTQGCLIVDAGVGYGITVDSVSVEDSNGNGQAVTPFNPAYLKFTNSLNTSVASLSYASNIKTGANTVSAVAVGSALTVGMQEVIAEFSGATTPDQEADATCSSCSNPIVTPSITIGQTELVVSYLYDSTVHTYTAPAGWTVCAKCFNTNTTSSYLAYRVLAAGTYSVSWTGSGSSPAAIYFIASFKH